MGIFPTTADVPLLPSGMCPHIPASPQVPTCAALPLGPPGFLISRAVLTPPPAQGVRLLCSPGGPRRWHPLLSSVFTQTAGCWRMFASGHLVWEHLGLARPATPCHALPRQHHSADQRRPTGDGLLGYLPFPLGCKSVPAMSQPREWRPQTAPGAQSSARVRQAPSGSRASQP